MATRNAHVPLGEGDDRPDVAVQRQWRMRQRLSSGAESLDAFLGQAGFDRAPWLVVAFAAGIGLWFWLADPWQWLAVILGGILASLCALVIWRDREHRANLMLAVIASGVALSAGASTIWARSAIVGTEALQYPRVEWLDARVLHREERPAENRVRLVLATRDPETARAIRVRINVPEARDVDGLNEGARIRVRSRLMPPASPLLPGAYDFARRAWFDGLAATGTVIGDIEVLEQAHQGGWIARAQRSLSAHVRSNLDGSAGSIAAAFASGDRGAIAEADDDAMRDAGLTHLLSISGLHVSAVIAAGYILSLKLMALWPWLTLRVRLPVLAAGIGASVGIGYTLLTGAEVPTVRSCVGALLVLTALALGRDALSMRMVAAAAFVVLLLWPESIAGPSFQMSFAAVIAIVSLHNARPVKDFLAPREESWFRWSARRTLMLFVTGLVIEIALTPIVLFHFHRAGLYGAFANVLAIPLVTFVSMPMIALALVLDVVGLGGPIWWLAGTSLDALLALAHFVAEQPGSVKLVPQMQLETLLLMVAGGFWLGLWRGKARLWGFGPLAIGAIMLAATPVPDLLITRDGRHVGIAGEDDRLLILRENRSGYARDNLLELAGLDGEPVTLDRWPGANCSSAFCAITLTRDGKSWQVLMARSDDLVEERALAAACDRADIVVADRFLPRSCKPRWLKADRRFLEREGGVTIYLSDARLETVAENQGQHGWWRGKP